MRRPKTLAAFTAEEYEKAHALLAARVAYMMGRKLEEGDWAEVYCRAKNIPQRGWSNLNIDIIHESLGVEHKMLCYRSKPDLMEACGRTLMHPSATRSIRVPTTDVDPDEAMRDVLMQYGRLIESRQNVVQEQSGSNASPDMRTGWLLWQESLRQFLYFEEEMIAPNPDDYIAKWVSSGGGSRKQSKNLWVYERETGVKRYSITTEAGAKVQPYFDVPPPTDPNLYLFKVIGEVISTGVIRVWITESTARELERLLGNLDIETISKAVLKTAQQVTMLDDIAQAQKEAAKSILITDEAYQVLQSALPGVSDEHSFQLLAQHLRNPA